ncbi:MAG: phytoene desaturase family protein, partial [Caldilineaceae bacterium]
MHATSPVKTVLIIGGGVAGLAAGCYAQMNGFQATILEKHKIAGGLCTAWTRQGYTFDTSLHMLGHSRKGGFLKMWRELGVIQGRILVDHPDGGLLEVDGERFTPPIDLDELERAMLARSPGDATSIHEMLEAARKCADFNLAPDKPFALMGVAESISFVARNLGLLRFMRKWGRIHVRDYAARFKDPLLRHFVASMENSVSWPMADVSMATLLITLNMAHERNMSYAIGGSYAVAQTMVQRFVQLGGTLRTRALVSGIVTRPDGAGDRAVGVRLDDGSELHADYVISAADGKTTIWNWLGGRYLNDAVTKAYATWKVFPPVVQVMLGVARSFEGESFAQSFPL